jgi:hypothetical protein
VNVVSAHKGMETLDPHQRPPDGIRNVYKKYQKLKSTDLDQDSEILDLESLVSVEQDGNLEIVKHLDARHLTDIFNKFTDSKQCSVTSVSSMPVYEHKEMPGKKYFKYPMVKISITLKRRDNTVL